MQQIPNNRPVRRWPAPWPALLAIILILILSLTQPLLAAPGDITTVAGNGTNSYSGDGGPATSASLRTPYGVALDSSGNLYIADYLSNRIRKVNSAGIISTMAGNGTNGYSGDGGPATSASLDYPYGVAVDNSGNLYIADSFNHRVRKVNSAGVITTVAGTGTVGSSGDGGPATSARLRNPASVAVDSSGNLYIADSGNHRVRKVNSAGVITTVAGTGTLGYNGDGGAATSARLNLPYSVVVDSSGNLYIGDHANHRIRKVDSAGVITTVAGTGTLGYSGDGGPAASAKLNYPYGVTVDSSDNLYIADTFNRRIRKVDSAGVITTVVDGTGINGLASPFGIAIDSSGNLYIADSDNHRVRMVQRTGGSPEIDVQGSGVSIASGDTTPSTADHTDFGTVAVSSGTVVRTFTIRNTGTAALSLSGALRVTVSGSSAFSVNSQPASNSVATGGNTPFQITFAPSAAGAVMATVSIVNNDSNENPYTFVIAGTGSQPDGDGDGVADNIDNCPTVSNANQVNTDGDALGDACDSDDDGDGVLDVNDAFPLDADEAVDTDHDGIGNNADPDDDNDGQSDADEAACGSNPLDAASTSLDTDGDGSPDCVDADDDNDGVPDANDAFPLNPNESVDTDGDGIGNNADPNDDNDGQSDADEAACGSNPLDAASTAPDNDGDNSPDCVDTDDDNDGVADANDNCPTTANSGQADFDHDGTGDACDPDDDNDGIHDNVDAFPFSDRSPMVVIGACDSGVGNQTLTSGATFNDLIAQAAANAGNHGDFVSAVSQLADVWKKAGLISGHDKGKITSCAAQSDIPAGTNTGGQASSNATDGVLNSNAASHHLFLPLITEQN